ncbi:MAG: hypothetical protein ACI4SP_03625, partial [Eubacteriales bacterium]
ITDSVTTPATCTATGVRTYTATVNFDGTDYTDTQTETIPALGHDFGEWSHNESEHWRVCSRDSFEERSVHEYGDWQITIQPTEESTGLKKHICSVCGEYEEKEIAKLVSSSGGTGSVVDLDPDKEYELEITLSATNSLYNIAGENKGYRVELWITDNGERISQYDDSKTVTLSLVVPHGMQEFTLYRVIGDRLDEIDASTYTVSDGIVTIRTTLTAEFVFNSVETEPSVGVQWWVWLIVGVAVVGVITAITLAVVMIKRKKRYRY